MSQYALDQAFQYFFVKGFDHKEVDSQAPDFDFQLFQRLPRGARKDNPDILIHGVDGADQTAASHVDEVLIQDHDPGDRRVVI